MIGNSDDKLTQAEWSDFVTEVDAVVRPAAVIVYGAWHSPSADPWQNACWSLEPRDDAVATLRAQLAVIGRHFRQDSIAWADAPDVEFL